MTISADPSRIQSVPPMAAVGWDWAEPPMRTIIPLTESIVESMPSEPA